VRWARSTWLDWLA